MFSPGQVVLDAVPAGERVRPLWDSVRQLAAGQPALLQWQRVIPSETAR